MRLFVFSRIGELPLLLSVGQPTGDIYKDWRRYALVMSFLIAALVAVAGTLTWYLAREMRRRADRAEAASHPRRPQPGTGRAASPPQASRS